MPDPSDNLHELLVAEVQRRLEVVRAATGRHWYSNGGWEIRTVPVGDVEAADPPFWFLVARPGEQRQSAWADFRHIALHDPADAVRRYEADLRRLERHAPRVEPASRYRPEIVECEHCASLCHSRSGLGCETPDAPWPCDEIADLAASLGMEVTE